MRLVVVLALVACSKSDPAPAPAPTSPPADDCKTFYDRSRPMLTDLALLSNKQFTEVDFAKFITDCHTQGAAAHKDPTMDCVLGAKDDQAIRDCWQTSFSAYLAAPK